MDNNAYLLRCRNTGEQVLIDAANDADRLLGLIGDGGLSTVITTHQHADHWYALEDVLEATGARSVAHPADARALPRSTRPSRMDRPSRSVIARSRSSTWSATRRARSPCSTATRAASPHLFTGDSLFPGGVGNTRGNAENFTSLINDVERKIFDRLPDDTWFYPGHGNDSTLGAERPSLPEWRARGW